MLIQIFILFIGCQNIFKVDIYLLGQPESEANNRCRSNIEAKLDFISNKYQMLPDIYHHYHYQFIIKFFT